VHFDEHHFLVNDASMVRKKRDANGEGHAHVARRVDGKLLLPAESLRGVLAHQAARIARTRGKCGEREEVKRCADGTLPSEIGCLTRLFGGSGWRSVLDISDFVEVGEAPVPGAAPVAKEQAPNISVQQFVAVDRFTAAGGSDSLKFDAQGGWQPHLKGRIGINLDRLKLLGDVEPSLGLLALALRDLVEGDMTFGWGAGKGYGWAAIDTDSSVHWVEATLNKLVPGSIRDWIGAWENGGK
jgi:hypothetical protein